MVVSSFGSAQDRALAPHDVAGVVDGVAEFVAGHGDPLLGLGMFFCFLAEEPRYSNDEARLGGPGLSGQALTPGLADLFLHMCRLGFQVMQTLSAD